MSAPSPQRIRWAVRVAFETVSKLTGEAFAQRHIEDIAVRVADELSPCDINSLSSRACERGTKACVTEHGFEQAATHVRHAADCKYVPMLRPCSCEGVLSVPVGLSADDVRLAVEIAAFDRLYSGLSSTRPMCADIARDIASKAVSRLDSAQLARPDALSAEERQTAITLRDTMAEFGFLPEVPRVLALLNRLLGDKP